MLMLIVSDGDDDGDDDIVPEPTGVTPIVNVGSRVSTSINILTLLLIFGYMLMLIVLMMVLRQYYLSTRRFAG